MFSGLFRQNRAAIFAPNVGFPAARLPAGRNYTPILSVLGRGSARQRSSRIRRWRSTSPGRNFGKNALELRYDREETFIS